MTGLVLLLSGVALFGYAGVVFWRAGRGWQRLWLLPGIGLCLFLMLPVAIAVMLTNVPPTPVGAVTPASSGLSYADVDFRTADGAGLSGWFVPARNGAAIVLLHGAGENRSATLPQAMILARRGFGVLMVDARGHGSSGGRGMDAGWYGDTDVTAAVDFLCTQQSVDPNRVGVLGLSMGGEEAIGAAAADRRIRAVVAEGATGRTAADKAGWLPGGVTGALQRAIDRITFAVAGLLTPAAQPMPLHEAISAAPRTHFLLITAGAVVDERRAAEHFRTAAPDRVEVWTVPGASHTHGLQARPGSWERHVVAFLDQVLH
jgi:pimeloyl-ACP methyl ester carboxylesterase